MTKKLLSSLVLLSGSIVGLSQLAASCGSNASNPGDGKDASKNEKAETFFTASRVYKNEDGTIKSYLNENIDDVFANSNTPQDKILVINVDGAQQTMYKNAFALFKKTPAFKKGYRISKIEKGVFDIIDTASNAGALDFKQSPDLFYAPSDRATSLAEKNMISDINQWDPSLLNSLVTTYHISDAQKQALLDYGNFIGTTRKDGKTVLEKRFIALRHNQEGIVLASNLTEQEAKKDLLKPENNSLEEIVANGKGLFYYQNFWFGNGILGGHFKNIETPEKNVAYYMNKSVYPNVETNQGASGWVETDENYAAFKPGIDIAARMSYQIWNAVYKMTDEQYAQSPWGQKGIKRGSLEIALQSDGGQFNNQIYSFFKEGKLNYTILGTWELQNAFKNGGVKSIFAVPNVKDGVEYLQAPGSWTYSINIRNTSSKYYPNQEERKDAIKSLLLAIYSPEASNAYFKADTKVPFLESLQDALKADVSSSSLTQNVEIQNFAVELGYANAKALKDKYLESVQAYDAASKATSGNGWLISTDANPLAEQNYLQANEFLAPLPDKSDLVIGQLKEVLQPALALQNSLAAMYNGSLNSEEATKLLGSLGCVLNPNLLVADQSVLDKYASLRENQTEWHLRKLEKEIWGVNGNSAADFLAQLVAIAVKLFDPATKEAAQAELQSLVDQKATQVN
ncbi:hypothetical protein [Mycoplasmopsis gallopavonis]|uniref:Lipoprotein n=1 Tax=Mycoplasmopsis gallopavonis TaxID=76629 RepID=A0A449AZJ3_9BACT|nr:hypothetical protein [Mycoplasmopsis gallopavonis]RIV16782.1 hypothetical protein D1113_00880 [Mycoplasmopsis gallopavonis]VEU72904.1 Uncharacterised protein [Mycoplasmopsis gallopavonis]